MVISTAGRLLAWMLAGEQRGGAALFMLLAFMVLAVPLVLAATQVAGQLARNSQVYETRLAESYAGASDVEFAISEILNPESQNIPEIREIPGLLDWDGAFGADVRVYKVTPDVNLLGQGLVVTQAVEYIAPAGQGTTFTYTLTVRNEGSGTATLERVVNYLPPGLSYDPNSTDVEITFTPDPGTSIAEPQIEPGNERCGRIPQQVTWSFVWNPNPPNLADGHYPLPHIHLEPQHMITLTFEATGAFPANTSNTYYNRATADYRGWWDSFSTPIEVSTPYGAEFPVGSGIGEACGFDLFALIGDTAITESELLGEPVDIDYTIRIENVSPGNLLLEKVYDTLPPGFSYKGPSTWDPDLQIANDEPAEEFLQRSQLTWTLEPAYPMASGDTVILAFVATGVVRAGVSYFNDVSAVFTSSEQSGKADIVLALDNRLSICDGVILECPPDGEIELDILKQAAARMVEEFTLETNDGNIRFGVTRFRGCSVSVAEMSSDADLLKNGIGATVSGATLAGAVGNEEVTFRAANQDELAEGKTIQIGGEQIYLRKIGNNLEVVRGLNGTAAVPHGEGAEILIFNSEGCQTTGNGGGAEIDEPDGIGVLQTTFTISQHGDLVEGQTVIVDGEHMRILSIVGKDLSVLRGQDFTTPVSHLNGARVLVFSQGPDLGINNIQPGYDLALGTNLIAALYGADAQFKSGTGERPGVPKSIIMISNFSDNSGASQEAIRLASADIDAEVFAVGVLSDGLNPQSQLLVATDPANVYIADDFSGLLFVIQNIIDNIPLLLTATGGTSSSTAVSGGTLYDIESVDAEGNSGLQSRVLMRQGAVEILSWQEK